MNSLEDNLKFTMETEEDFTNTLPTLDTQVWIDGNGMVKYMFYEKPMASTRVTHRRSAMGENAKMASLSQELIRRLTNTSIDLPQNIIDGVLVGLSLTASKRTKRRRISLTTIYFAVKPFQIVLLLQRWTKLNWGTYLAYRFIYIHSLSY